MRSISFRLFSLIAAFLLLLLILLNYFSSTSLRDVVMEEKESSFSSQGSVIASSLSVLDSMSEGSVAEVMRILDIRDYDRIIVCNTGGTVLYDSDASAGARTTQQDLFTAMEEKTVFRSRFYRGSFISSYAMPVHYQGTLTGAVYLYELDTDNASIILDFRKLMNNTSLIIASIALLFALAFSISIYRRFHTVTLSMRIVGNGDYSHRLKISGNDELTDLVKEFNTLTERLENNEKQRRQFVADASHELKTPLASIRLLSDSIVQNEGMDSATVREFVADIGTEANRLQRTTEKLLDLSRLDDTSVHIVPEPVDMKRVTENALSILSPLADENHVSLHADLDDGCVVMATSDDIFHILFNLVENAIKYNVTNGSVRIKLSQDDQEVRFSVADTGIGIPEADRIHVFSRFYRVDKARSREAGGSGLGLSIVHDAVLAHNGTITIGVNRPQGSVFIVTFPRPTPEETGI